MTSRVTNSCWQPTSILPPAGIDRKSTRLNSSHVEISYAVFCLKKKQPTTGSYGCGQPRDLNRSRLRIPCPGRCPVRSSAKPSCPSSITDSPVILFFFFIGPAPPPTPPLPPPPPLSL